MKYRIHELKFGEILQNKVFYCRKPAEREMPDCPFWAVVSEREDGTLEPESGPQASRELAEIELGWIQTMEGNN
jgi:hypothetical protein